MLETGLQFVCYTIPTHISDLEVKVVDFEFLDELSYAVLRQLLFLFGIKYVFACNGYFHLYFAVILLLWFVQKDKNIS